MKRTLYTPTRLVGAMAAVLALAGCGNTQRAQLRC